MIKILSITFFTIIFWLFFSFLLFEVSSELHLSDVVQLSFVLVIGILLSACFFLSIYKFDSNPRKSVFGFGFLFVVAVIIFTYPKWSSIYFDPLPPYRSSTQISPTHNLPSEILQIDFDGTYSLNITHYRTFATGDDEQKVRSYYSDYAEIKNLRSTNRIDIPYCDTVLIKTKLVCFDAGNGRSGFTKQKVTGFIFLSYQDDQDKNIIDKYFPQASNNNVILLFEGFIEVDRI